MNGSTAQIMRPRRFPIGRSLTSPGWGAGPSPEHPPPPGQHAVDSARVLRV